MNDPERKGVIIFSQAPILPQDPLSKARAVIKTVADQKPLETIQETAAKATGETQQK